MRPPADLQRALEHHRAGHLDAAEAGYRRVLAWQPKDADALHLLGALLHARGHDEEAVGLLRRAVELRPREPYFQNDLGIALAALGRHRAAEAAYRAARRLAPDFPAAAVNLCNLLAATERCAEAEAACHDAVRLAPEAALAHLSLGAALAGLGRFPEAEKADREAVRLTPRDPVAHAGLGAALHQQNRVEEAVLCYRRAIALKPDYAEAHLNLAMSLLALGNYAEGWREYEWRWQTEQHPLRHAAPLWQGEPLAGRTVLLYPEQGLGDAIQFMRYAPLVAAAGGRVVLEMPQALARLAATLDGVKEVVVEAEGHEPAADLCAPLMSLPLRLGTEVATIPGRVPYLRADPAAVGQWRRRLGELPGLRVGLVWAGGRRPQPGAAAVDRRRSMRLAQLAPLAAVPGVSFVSLQKGEPAAEAGSPPPGMALHDWTEELADFADTAALVEALDLVVGVDTAVVHLAGALAKPVWLLSRHDACWRWLLDRADSPWYPTLRHFRQQLPGDWPPVVEAVRRALARHCGKGDR